LIESWRTDPLIDAKDSKSCLALPSVEPFAFARSLGGGGAFAFEAGLDSGVDKGWLRVPLPTPDLERRLLLMRRTQRRSLADRGEHALWVALGLFVWQTPDGAEHTSPLALWPVELERSDSGLRLVSTESVQPRINTALVATLERELTVVLAQSTAAHGTEPLDLTALFDAADGIAVTRPGWRVERGCKLGLFSLGRHVLAAELAARTDELLAHPVVAQLLSAGTDAMRPFAQPSPAAAESVTRPTPSYDVLAPLDADASQLSAIAAASTGATFVLQAAPGTGASQTIANLAVHAAASGKRVLVISDKAPALDTIVARLAAIGLGEMCLPLYGAHADRTRTLGQLARVVERTFRPAAGPQSAATVDARTGELRAILDNHVHALHRIGPFGRSLHDVLGRLIELKSTPDAHLAERDAVGLDGKTFEQRHAAVLALAAAALPVEPVATHPWRESTLESNVGEMSLKSVALAALDDAASAADLLAVSLAEILRSVPGLVAKSREQLSSLGALALVAASSPRPGVEMLTNLRAARDEDLDERVALIRARGTGTVETPRDPLAFLALAHKHRALRTEVEDHFTDSVEKLDAAALWSQLRKWTNSMGPLRFVALRTARAEVKSAAMPGHLEADSAMIAALEAVVAERATRAALLAAAEPAKRWFGDLGGDALGLDLNKLDEAVAWSSELRKAFDAVEIGNGEAGRQTVWRALVAQVAAGVPMPASSGPEANSFGRLADAVARWSPSLVALGTATGIPTASLAAGEDHLVALRERIETLRLSIDALPAWVAFHGVRGSARKEGVDAAVTAMERGDLGAADLAHAWERATLIAWADAELAESQALSQFHGASHHAQVSAFADMDRGALALARARAVVKLAEMTPRVRQDETGELATLQQELKHPVRSLRGVLAALPQTLGRMAPCILATPVSAADFLDGTKFDIVVIDEASRLTTAQTAAVIARADSAVIVGDTARSVPSATLLEDAAAARLPELWLARHYRSKHEDLIAFANQHRYGDRLEVFAVAQPTSDLGVAARRVEGAFDRDTLVNRIEAEAVVADVLARLRDPAQRTRSIAVIALTSTQRELIEDLLDDAREGDPALDAAIEPGSDATFEPLLVTDLATANGDERDVVIFSVGYGVDNTNILSIDHGPLTEPGGERLLGAAQATAREQLVVFASVAAEDLPTDGAEGTRALAALLAFAQRGGGALRRVDELAPASPITDAIARALAERGWQVRHRVGVGPYTLDLAVVDPNNPEQFVLAIEHDGAAYAQAPHARDRDRLRPAVLAQLGWRLHRVWGLDWWLDPEREVQRAHGAIVTAIAGNRSRRPGVTKPPRIARASIQPPISAAGTPTPSTRVRATGSAPVVSSARPRTAPQGVTVKTQTSDAVLAAGSGPTAATPLAAYDGPTTPVRLARNQIAIGPYSAAAIPAGRRTPDDLFAPRYLGEVQKIVEQVLAAEAPMHVDLLARRVGGYFGIGRLSQRVTDQVKLALEGRGRFGDEDNIVWRLDQDPSSVPAVRVSGSNSAARRAIEEVPLAELASAARIVVERASGITTAELVRDSARLLGFARITDQVTERITLGVRLAIARQLVRVSDANKVLLPEA
jgi:very-short-patch-repair endonuclease